MSLQKVNFPKKLREYELSELIGIGGMGQVFLAHHELLDRQVAIKRFAPARDDMNTDENRERFLREGKALAGLRHTGIVSVFELFEYRTQMYLVLEYVDGFNLEKILEKGALPLDVACIVGLAIAEALEHAHFHGIVHRDIKPSNVMIAKDGQVKLMDFGIARHEELDKVTKTGSMVGTPMYLSPEVVKGKEADERADVYALGAMLYYALSGRKLFAHATQESLFHHIASGKFPKLEKVSQGLPRRLRQIVHRCLAKNPERRFQSASELRQELELFLASRHVWANHAQRMVGYLEAKDFLSEKEATTWIDVDVSGLFKTGTFETRMPRSYWKAGITAGALLMTAGIGAWAGYKGWLDALLSVFGTATR